MLLPQPLDERIHLLQGLWVRQLLRQEQRVRCSSGGGGSGRMLWCSRRQRLEELDWYRISTLIQNRWQVGVLLAAKEHWRQTFPPDCLSQQT